jgi:hypothetical protein
MSISLNPTQLSAALRAAVTAKPRARRVLVKGKPGIGKTEIVRSLAASLGATLVIMHPSVSDPTDFKGFPWVVDGKAEFISFGQLRTLDEAKSLTICFIDDLGQGTTAVQAAVMQLLDRYKGHPHVVFLAATNSRTDGAGVTGLLEPVKSRFDSILELGVHFPSWKLWAEEHDVDYRIIGYLEQQPDALHKFDKTVDIVNQPCPRTWESADAILKMDIPEELRFVMLVGAVGEAAATTFRAFLKIAEQAPSREEIIADPKNARVPEESSAVYAVASALVHGIVPKEFPAIAIYAERMYAAEHGDFCGLLMRDVMRKIGDDIKDTRAFTKLAKSPLAKLVMEAARYNQNAAQGA